MKIFEGKSPTERNKMIAAIVLGAMALLAIGYNIIAFFPGSRTTVNVSVSPTPTPASSSTGDTFVTSLPSQREVDFNYLTTPIVYSPGQNLGGTEPGRNIFAFYEPPRATPYSPTPYVEKTPPTPTPEPPPPWTIQYIAPQQNIYAGSRGFRLEVSGGEFAPEAQIFIDRNPLPTNYVSAQRLTADIPANFIVSPGTRFIIVQTPDGKYYSNQVSLQIQPQPQPEFQYIGSVRPRGQNNVTAYVQEKGATIQVAKRLGDVVGGRFRLVSIAPTNVVVEDVSLGFRHTVELAKGTGQPTGPVRSTTGFPTDGTYQPYNPNMPNYNQPNPPGIPNTVPRYTPPNPNQNPNQNSNPNQNPNQKKDDSDDDDDGDN